MKLTIFSIILAVASAAPSLRATAEKEAVTDGGEKRELYTFSGSKRSASYKEQYKQSGGFGYKWVDNGNYYCVESDQEDFPDEFDYNEFVDRSRLVYAGSYAPAVGCSMRVDLGSCAYKEDYEDPSTGDKFNIYSC